MGNTKQHTKPRQFHVKGIFVRETREWQDKWKGRDKRKKESEEGVFSLFIWKNDITQVRVGGEPSGFWDMVVVGLATGLQVTGCTVNS